MGVTSAPSPSPEAGLILDQRYRVDSKIARGGMATVFRGFDERLERPIALKIMHPHLAENPDFIRRFAREARSAARLTHPHVVGVFDQGEDFGHVYLTMQLVEGETLRQELRREGPLTLRRALRVGRDTLAAIDAAHRSGIIHRDIKPENVLVAEDKDVLVADFGLARAIDSATASATGTLLGTVAYVSPEVVTKGFCDARSDLYSWGILLFEMLTGRVPFTGESPVHVAYQHAHEDVPAPSTINSAVPPSVDSIVTWACSRLPSSRPSRAAALLDALDEVIAQLSDAQLDAAPAVHDEDSPTHDLPRLTRTIPSAEEHFPDLTSTLPAAAPVPFPIDPDDDAAADPGGDGGAAATGSTAVERDESARELTLGPRTQTHGRHLHGPLRSVPARIAALALALAALGAWGVAGSQWYAYAGPGAERTVPVLAGTPLTDAENVLAAQNIDTRTVEQFSAEVPKGHIISVDPAAGATIKRGDTITVVVSKGEELFAVPDVTGKPVEEATAALDDAGFTVVEDDPEFDEKVPKGTVISQQQDGDALPKGAEVHVTVSKGREPIAVPVVTGASPDQARTRLEAAGLTVKQTEAFSSAPKGTVASQQPADGSLFRGDAVTIVVSKGPEMVKVPNVFEKPEAAAKAELEKAGFTVSVEHDKGEPVFGKVYKQDQAAGSEAEKGSTITIRVF